MSKLFGKQIKSLLNPIPGSALPPRCPADSGTPFGRAHGRLRDAAVAEGDVGVVVDGTVEVVGICAGGAAVVAGVWTGGGVQPS